MIIMTRPVWNFLFMLFMILLLYICKLIYYMCFIKSFVIVSVKKFFEKLLDLSLSF